MALTDVSWVTPQGNQSRAAPRRWPLKKEPNRTSNLTCQLGDGAPWAVVLQPQPGSQVRLHPSQRLAAPV